MVSIIIYVFQYNVKFETEHNWKVIYEKITAFQVPTTTPSPKLSFSLSSASSTQKSKTQPRSPGTTAASSHLNP